MPRKPKTTAAVPKPKAAPLPQKGVPRMQIVQLPVQVRLPEAPDAFGISRSAIYRAAAQGHVKLSKLGKTTLVDTASMLTFLGSLPSYKPGLS